MFEEAGLGRLVVRELGLGDPEAEPDLDSWRALVARIKAPKRAVEIALVGKYIELPDAYLSRHRGAPPRGVGPRRRRQGPLGRLRGADEGEPPRPARGRGRDPRPGRLRPSRHRGQGPRRPLRPRPQGPVPGAVPRAAVRGHRVRPRGHGLQGRELDRVRHVHRAPGDRLHARPARARGQGRDDAPGPLPGPARRPARRPPRSTAPRSSTSATATASRSTTATARRSRPRACC